MPLLHFQQFGQGEPILFLHGLFGQSDNLLTIGLELIFGIVYSLILIITIILLSIRYIILSFGVIFLPVAIFFYFVPPLKSYGQLILNSIGVLTFITFICSIVILGCSMVTTLPIYENLKTLIMITCFLIIDVIFLMGFWQTVIKSSIPTTSGKFKLAAKFITKVV